MEEGKRFFLCSGKVVKYADLYLAVGAHIIGDLRYVTDEGRRVTALARWEVATACDVVPPVEPEVDLYLVGDARRIKCRHAGCDRRPRWEMGRAAIGALLARMGLEYPSEEDNQDVKSV